MVNGDVPSNLFLTTLARNLPKIRRNKNPIQGTMANVNFWRPSSPTFINLKRSPPNIFITHYLHIYIYIYTYLSLIYLEKKNDPKGKHVVLCKGTVQTKGFGLCRNREINKVKQSPIQNVVDPNLVHPLEGFVILKNHQNREPFIEKQHRLWGSN